MNIPTTLAELRANVAACTPETTFHPQWATSCIITQPLNSDPLTPSGRFSYNPLTNHFHDEQGEHVHFPNGQIQNLASEWDNSYTEGYAQTRDEALACNVTHVDGTLEGETA